MLWIQGLKEKKQLPKTKSYIIFCAALHKPMPRLTLDSTEQEVRSKGKPCTHLDTSCRTCCTSAKGGTQLVGGTGAPGPGGRTRAQYLFWLPGPGCADARGDRSFLRAWGVPAVPAAASFSQLLAGGGKRSCQARMQPSRAAPAPSHAARAAPTPQPRRSLPAQPSRGAALPYLARRDPSAVSQSRQTKSRRLPSSATSAMTARILRSLQLRRPHPI